MCDFLRTRWMSASTCTLVITGMLSILSGLLAPLLDLKQVTVGWIETTATSTTPKFWHDYKFALFLQIPAALPRKSPDPSAYQLVHRNSSIVNESTVKLLIGMEHALCEKLPRCGRVALNAQ